MEGLDVGRGLRIVSKRLPENADCLGERRVGDEGVLPDGIDQLLPRDDVTGAPEQELEDAEDAWRKRDFAAVATEQPRLRVELERAKREARQTLTIRRRSGGFGGRHGEYRHVIAAWR